MQRIALRQLNRYHSAKTHRRGILAALLLLTSFHAWALGPLAASASEPTRMYADVIDIAPWGRVGADGKPVGVYADIFKRLSDRSGCPLELRLTPITRAVAEVSGDAAQATIVLDRVDLNAKAVPVGEVTALRIEMWLPPGSTTRKLEDLEGKMVGVLRGPTYHEAFDANTKIQKYSVTSLRQQLEMLNKGRPDGAIGVRENFLTAAKELNMPVSAFTPPIVLGTRIVKLWVSPGLRSSHCTPRLARALADMRHSGEMDRLISEGSKAAH